MSSDFEFIIDGVRFTSIERGWVRRRLDTAADSYQLQFADIRQKLGTPLPIQKGRPCVIKLRGKTLLTGYVDDVSYQYKAERLALTARGRSRTGDLVDCSAIHGKSGRWHGAKLLDIVADIARPYGIAVTIDRLKDYDLAFNRFALEPGESCMDAIMRACKLRGFWPTNTVDGDLHISRAGELGRVPLQLKYGVNIMEGQRYDSMTSRHSVYLLKGQVPSDESISGRAAAQLADAVFDDGVDRYRPLLLVSTGHDRRGDLKRRAQWERNRRAGTDERILYRVDDYGYSVLLPEFRQSRDDGFALWKPNEMVQVDDPRLNIDGWWLISAVSYRFAVEKDDAMRATDLTLTRKEAFNLDNYPKPTGGIPNRDWLKGFDPSGQPPGIALPGPAGVLVPERADEQQMQDVVSGKEQPGPGLPPPSPVPDTSEPDIPIDFVPTDKK